MPQPKGNEQARHEIEHQTPGVTDIAGNHFKIARQHDEKALSHNGRNAIEGRTDAHKLGLLVTVEPQHIETIGSNVVGGTGEGHQPEEGQGALQPIGARDGKGHTC